MRNFTSSSFGVLTLSGLRQQLQLLPTGVAAFEFKLDRFEAVDRGGNLFTRLSVKIGIAHETVQCRLLRFQAFYLLRQCFQLALFLIGELAWFAVGPLLYRRGR